MEVGAHSISPSRRIMSKHKTADNGMERMMDRVDVLIPDDVYDVVDDEADLEDDIEAEVKKVLTRHGVFTDVSVQPGRTGPSGQRR